MMKTFGLLAALSLAQAAQQPQQADPGTDPKIYWAILLIACAVVLGLVEIFVPSGAILAFAAAACAVGGVVLMFMVNTTLGLIGAIVVLVGSLVLFAFGIKVLPETPVVRWLTLGGLGGGDEDEEQPQQTAAAGPVSEGDTGQALTDLRPVGTCLINGKRLDCLAGSRVIEKGAQVRVVSVDGMHIKVRAEQ